MRTTVSAMDLPRDGRIRVWASYTELNHFGAVGLKTDQVLYLRQVNGVFLSEMIDFGNLPARLLQAA